MTFRTRSLASLIACAALFAARWAHAEATSAEISAAKLAFESALAAESEQRWGDAAQKLREAVAVKDTPGLRFHLAHCETEQGHLLAASAEYDRATELLRQGATAPDVQKLLEPARAALLLRLPRLTLKIPDDVHAPQVFVDNRPHPPSDVALGLPLDPGVHELRVQAVGRRTFERALSLKEGDRVVLPVRLAVAAPLGGPSESPLAPPAPAPTSSVPVAPAAKPGRSSTKLYLMVGESVLTAAGLAVGIAYAVAKGSASDRIDSAQARIDAAPSGGMGACGASDSELSFACSDLHAAISDHDRALILSDVGFAAAGVGAAALLATGFLFPSSSQASGVNVQPVVGLGGLGLVGSF